MEVWNHSIIHLKLIEHSMLSTLELKFHKKDSISAACAFAVSLRRHYSELNDQEME